MESERLSNSPRSSSSGSIERSCSEASEELSSTDKKTQTIGQAIIEFIGSILIGIGVATVFIFNAMALTPSSWEELIQLGEQTPFGRAGIYLIERFGKTETEQNAEAPKEESSHSFASKPFKNWREERNQERQQMEDAKNKADDTAPSTGSSEYSWEANDQATAKPKPLTAAEPEPLEVEEISEDESDDGFSAEDLLDRGVDSQMTMEDIDLNQPG